MKRIPLTQGKFTIVDDGDYEWLIQWGWYALRHRNTYYAVRNQPISKSKRTLVLMHRQIIQTPPGLDTDHINGNGIDNQRKNLRFCTNAQNQYNAHAIRGISQYKGVTFCKRSKKWKAQIVFNSKNRNLGTYKKEIDAAKAYDKKAVELFGEFAYCNFRQGEQNEISNVNSSNLVSVG